MERKEIQEQRMRNYFIQATKEILKAEGLHCVSVRNVAERAGYSYATLYNYFKDVKDLIFICVEDFQNECKEFIDDRISKNTRGIERIKEISNAYIHYFLEYPGIYELFFVEKMNDITSKQSQSEMICNFLDCLCEASWKEAIKERAITEEIAQQKKMQLRYQVNGLLLFYLHRNNPPAYQDFCKTTNDLLNLILSK